MSIQQNTDDFNEIMRAKTWWARLLGTQFATGIATYVGQMVERCESLARRLLQEAFLSTAVKRSSILAAAEDRGYVGRKVTPSTGKVLVTNNTTGSLVLPYGAPLIAPNQLDYVITQAAQLQPGDSLELEIGQLTEVVITTTIGEGQKWLEILLPLDVSAKATRVDVYVTPPGKPQTLWEKRYQFRRAGPDAKVYTEFYKATEQLGIRFGNGISGAIPPTSSVIQLTVWCSVGDSTLIEGQPLELEGQTEAVKAAVTIRTVTPIAGGAAGESTEDVRKGALYITPYDEQIVWDNDYRHFIHANIPNLSWLQVWGEVQQEKVTGFSINNIGRIFISAYSPVISQERLEELIIALFEGTRELNRRYTFVPPNRQPFTLVLKGVLYPRQQAESVKQVLMTALIAGFGENAVGADGASERTIYEKDIWATLDDLAVLQDFTIELVGRAPVAMPGDYVFLDAIESTYDLRYENGF